MHIHRNGARRHINVGIASHGDARIVFRCAEDSSAHLYSWGRQGFCGNFEVRRGFDIYTMPGGYRWPLGVFGYCGCGLWMRLTKKDFCWERYHSHTLNVNGASSVDDAGILM